MTETPTSDAGQAELPGMVRATVAESQAKARATRERNLAQAQITDVDPIARVLVDVPLAHLDRTFDYAVPLAMAESAQPGVRVKVRFAGKDVDGFVVERRADSEHSGRLQPLRRVVSAEPVLSPEIATLAHDVARRYAGVRADVLRLAVPPRHAGAENEDVETTPPPAAADPDAARAAWAEHEHGPAFITRLGSGDAPRAVWNPAPGADWPSMLAQAALSAPGGVVVCLPDHRDVTRMVAAFEALGAVDQHVVLSADLGPAQRYRSFLALSRGQRRIAVGTRAAAFAPVRDLALVAIWDDGDDLYAEQRAPYPHAREVLLLRAEQSGCAALIGGFARSVESDHLIRTGWARPLVPQRQRLRATVRVDVAGASESALRRDPMSQHARIPREVLDLCRSALESGPVLVQTPRRGYAAALACERCRTAARCAACTGPLRLTGPTRPPVCHWCALEVPAWACTQCGHRGLRAPVLGEERTAEELGRALPGARVLSSSGARLVATVPDRPAVVVATVGAEPVAERGYVGVVILDTWLALDRPGLRGNEEAFRRWSNALGLVRPGGRAVVVGDPAHPAIQALVRTDPAGFAARESDQRREAHLPPASRLATVEGPLGAVDDALTLLVAPDGVEVLGPVELEDDRARLVVRAPRARGGALSAALGELQRLRSARKLDPVRIQVDPPALD